MQEQLEFSLDVNNVPWNKACLKLNVTEKGQNCKRKEFKTMYVMFKTNYVLKVCFLVTNLIQIILTFSFSFFLFYIASMNLMGI